MEEIVKATNSALAKEANSHHRAAGDLAVNAWEHYIAAGGALTAAKGKMKHGKWLTWVDDNLEFEHATASRYVVAYKNREVIRANFSRVRNLALRDMEKFLADPAFYQSSAETVWSTPLWLYNLLDKEFGFETDVCATPENAKCKRFFTKETDGLSQDWDGICWMNPPYGREITNWMRKARDSANEGATIVCLVPGAYETEWFWSSLKEDEVRLIGPGRVKWTGMTSATFPSAVIILRPPKKRTNKIVSWEINNEKE